VEKMNWLFLVIIAYIIISALRGYHKGFIKVVYSMAAILITILFVFLTAPAVGKGLRAAPFYDSLRGRCEEVVRNQAKKHIGSGVLVDSVFGFDLPEEFTKQIEGKTEQMILETMEEEGIYRNIARTLADVIIGIIAFLISLSVILLILWKIGRTLDLFEKTPGIHLTNRIFGLIAGIVRAFIVIWFVFMLIRLTPAFPASSSLIELIKENKALNDLYENNRLLELLRKK